MQNKKMFTGTRRVLVLGGYGFIGRYIVEELGAQGYEVIVGTRGNSGAMHGPAPSERWLKIQTMLNEEAWAETLCGVDAVVNAVGILRERRGESFDQVHHLAVKSLASACAMRGMRIVHISAMAIEKTCHSEFSGSKLRGEKALLASSADCRIVRASLVEGEGAYGWTWFKRVARWPVHFIPEKNALISPVRVELLARAVAALLIRDDLPRRVYEVANGRQFNLTDYLAELSGGYRRPVIAVPDRVARFVARLCDFLHLTPFTQGHYEILKYDNCAETNDLYALIDREKVKRRECLFFGETVWI